MFFFFSILFFLLLFLLFYPWCFYFTFCYDKGRQNWQIFFCPIPNVHKFNTKIPVLSDKSLKVWLNKRKGKKERKIRKGD